MFDVIASPPKVDAAISKNNQLSFINNQLIGHHWPTAEKILRTIKIAHSDIRMWSGNHTRLVLMLSSSSCYFPQNPAVSPFDTFP